MAVVALLGRVFMKPIDCPFRAADKIWERIPSDVKIRFLDFHAEATSEKQLMGRYLNGRATAVLGTHTHVATADETILSGGTAFMCDLGMTGPHSGIIGREYENVLEATLTFNPTTFEVARGEAQINGAIVDVDPGTGKAVKIEKFRFFDPKQGLN
ncbi:MAG: YmdB family metallophosphoesterase [Thermoguttaceae bacterium]|nr:YmdB family metallophosphoesterase [Thermoguttaceae bacterium]